MGDIVLYRAMNNKEIEDLEKILEQAFISYGLYGFTSIAFGDALTKLYEKELALGYKLPTPAKKAFLYTATKNLILSEKRRQKKLKHIEDKTNDLENDLSLINANFELDENNKLSVEEMLNLLPEKPRQIMVMKYLEGYTEKQIAAKLEITISQVEEILRASKRALKRKLRDKRK
jgi:RNA polymerase sigma factor (sigma-70 family)